MKRINYLKELLNTLEADSVFVKNPDYRYIGTGNPMADILIIGKETSVSDKTKNQYKFEHALNYEHWKKLMNTNLDINKIPEFTIYETYSPLYPYKGQLLKIDNDNNKGTSRTWYNYQKLINLINNQDTDSINFHEFAFITEVNSDPSPKTRNAQTDSNAPRKEVILKSKFIQDFPIVIISGVGYFNISDNINEIESIFNVNFSRRENACGNEKQPYWIHKNNPGFLDKLVINTYQLSMVISDNLLTEVAKEIISFRDTVNINK